MEKNTPPTQQDYGEESPPIETAEIPSVDHMKPPTQTHLQQPRSELGNTDTEALT